MEKENILARPNTPSNDNFIKLPYNNSSGLITPENPCVPSSNLGGATTQTQRLAEQAGF